MSQSVPKHTAIFISLLTELSISTVSAWASFWSQIVLIWAIKSSKPFKTKVLDKPRVALHLGHLWSRLFLYQLSIYASHPTKVEQLEHAIIGGFARICLRIQHWKASSEALMNDRLKWCLKASLRNLLISTLISLISSANSSWDSLQLQFSARYHFLEVLLISSEFSLSFTNSTGKKFQCTGSPECQS